MTQPLIGVGIIIINDNKYYLVREKMHMAVAHGDLLVDILNLENLLSIVPLEKCMKKQVYN